MSTTVVEPSKDQESKRTQRPVGVSRDQNNQEKGSRSHYELHIGTGGAGGFDPGVNQAG